MEIEMILGDIRENRHIVVDSIVSVVENRMTGGLDNRIFTSRFFGLFEEFLEYKRRWGCHLHIIFRPLSVDTIVCSREHKNLFSGMLETTSHEIRNRRLSFAARDTDDYHISSGISMEMEGNNSPEIVVKYPKR